MLNPNRVKTGDIVRVTYSYSSNPQKPTFVFWSSDFSPPEEVFAEGIAPHIKYYTEHQFGIILSVIPDPHRKFSMPRSDDYHMFDWAAWVLADNQLFLTPLCYISKS